MSSLAVITGASAGIGAELAVEHARRGGDVILVARRKPELTHLAKTIESDFGVKAVVRAQDLSGASAAHKLADWLEKEGYEPDVLINNAGFGGHGQFVEQDLPRLQAMIDLNVSALVTLCHRVGGGMAERGSGQIMNVGSIAGFLPGPGQAVYYASKAFVNSFTQALAHELKGSGVTATVLCPGPVHTEFQSAADMDQVKMFDSLGTTPDKVARYGYKAMLRGQVVAIHQPRNKATVQLVKFLPRGLVRAVSSKSMEKS